MVTWMGCVKGSGGGHLPRRGLQQISIEAQSRNWVFNPRLRIDRHIRPLLDLAAAAAARRTTSIKPLGSACSFDVLQVFKVGKKQRRGG